MASCEATGPPVHVCVPPASVVTSWMPSKFWIDAAGDQHDRDDERERQQDAQRDRAVRSTQKLPSRSVRERAKPRTRAIATAMPTAAETKFCTARPAICTR